MSNDHDLPIEKMNEVNWECITEQQAAGFGLSLSLYNDAVEDHRLSKVAVVSRVSSLATAAVVGLVLLTWTRPDFAVFGVIVTLCVGTVGPLLRAFKTNEMLKKASGKINKEIQQLAQG